ncbi:putative secreted protein [Corynebacterium kutscheri]|uniref:glycine betaine ABC transporter substrate-binding protein n=1 Tax=Corynebacterium kutscheri TaxID=35755 RepID=UPI000F7033E8|nr:ABC transporter substrate-binding protein [Corynebacterium kutscheri]VEH79282.1 putative secreted protein [Corynebacterium kutscheri]
MKKFMASIIAIGTALALSACGTPESFGGGELADSDTIVIGSQAYYSNEIIAAAYAQALEDAGYKVKRDFRIGQREVYIRDVESGEIDLFPEYTGPLLQYWHNDVSARESQEVYEQLVAAAPAGVQVLDQSPATDQDSYVVSEQFSREYSLTSATDLKNVTVPLVLGANSEAESRPNGPQGLKNFYGVDVGFTPIEDSGGPLTVKALQDGQVNIAILYTADPSISENNLTVLSDPAHLFLASHVVPIASDDLDQHAQEIINKLSAALTLDVLLELNKRSINDRLSAEEIARDWVATLSLS